MNFNISPNSKTENKYILQNRKQNQTQPSFKGIEAAGGVANWIFTQIQTNKIVQYTLLDLGSMVIPRTVVDFTRSKDAGIETGCREFSGTLINELIPGVMAVGVGSLLGKIINPKIKINTSLPIESSAVEMLHDSWNAVNGHKFWEQGADKKQVIQDYVRHVFNNTQGLSGSEWKKLNKTPDVVETLSGKVAEIILNKSSKPKKEDMAVLNKLIVKTLGASESIKVKTGNSAYLETTVSGLNSNIIDIGRELLTKVKNNELKAAVAKYTKTSKIKAIITIAAVIGLAFSQQFVNRYFTKKRTGKDGFVGLSEESRKEAEAEKNNKNSKRKLMLAKIASVAGLWAIASSTITGTINPKKIIQTLTSQNIIKKLEYNSMFPHVNQLRVAYAAMITGRMLAASDKHELRETDIRDYAGFLNWLVLGSFVSKGVGKCLSKGKLMNTANPLEKGSNILSKVVHFIANEDLMSHSEIDARKGIDFATKKLLKTKLNIAIFSGIAYSTLALGLFMPMLNKHITDKLTAKKKPQNEPNKDVAVNISFNSINNEVFANFIKTQQGFKKV
jgi:hypothetical protein